MEGRDPLRTLYVGVLSTLLVLTGCVGFFGDDVVDSVSAQVSVDDFKTMQSTVSALETLAASHTTDIMALEDRIESLEMGPDMSTFATDIQLMQLQTQVNILQSQYDAHQHSSGGGGQPTASSNVLPILETRFNIIDTFYHPDDITELSQIHQDATDTTASVHLSCTVYHPEGESITGVGIDYDHDGVTDMSVQVAYDAITKMHHCVDGDEDIDKVAVVYVPVTEFNILDNFAYLTLGFRAVDASGDASWDVAQNTVRVITWQDWMAVDFTVSDAPGMTSHQADDDLLVFEFETTVSGLSVGLAYCEPGYTNLPEYCISIQVMEVNGPTWCRVGHSNWGDGGCAITNTAMSPLGNGYELSHGDQFTLTEDSEVWDQLCDPEYRDIECLLSILCYDL